MYKNQGIEPDAVLEQHDYASSLARSLLFDDHHVDEVVRQAWLQHTRKRPEHPAAMMAWLQTVPRFLTNSLHRTVLRRQVQTDPVAPCGIAPSAAAIVLREEMRRRVFRAVVALNEPYRSTVILRYFEDLSPSEIAARTGASTPTVRLRIKRGLEQLRSRLDKVMADDRQAWMLGLVPIAAAGQSSAVGLTALRGRSLFMLLAATAYLFSLLFGLWISRS